MTRVWMGVVAGLVSLWPLQMPAASNPPFDLVSPARAVTGEMKQAFPVFEALLELAEKWSEKNTRNSEVDLELERLLVIAHVVDRTHAAMYASLRSLLRALLSAQTAADQTRRSALEMRSEVLKAEMSVLDMRTQIEGLDRSLAGQVQALAECEKSTRCSNAVKYDYTQAAAKVRKSILDLRENISALQQLRTKLLAEAAQLGREADRFDQLRSGNQPAISVFDAVIEPGENIRKRLVEATTVLERKLGRAFLEPHVRAYDLNRYRAGRWSKAELRQPERQYGTPLELGEDYSLDPDSWDNERLKIRTWCRLEIYFEESNRKLFAGGVFDVWWDQLTSRKLSAEKPPNMYPNRIERECHHESFLGDANPERTDPIEAETQSTVDISRNLVGNNRALDLGELARRTEALRARIGQIAR